MKIDAKVFSSQLHVTLLPVALFIFICITFIAHYYNLVAESIGIVSILRVIDGLPHISQGGDLPSNLSPYGAYYYIILGKIFKILGLKNIPLITMLLRTLSLGILLSLPFIGKRVHSSFHNPKNWPLLFISMFVISFPFMAFMIRSDWVAYLLEFSGLILLWRYSLHNFPSNKVLVAGVFFGLAPLFKLNSLGILSGVGLYFLLIKEWRPLLLLIFACGFTTFLGGYLSFLHLGETYLLHVLHAANYGVLPLRNVPGLLTSLFIGQILGNLHFWIIFIAGYLALKKENRHAPLIAIPILTNIVVAAFSQFKIGAGFNYFLPSYIAGILLFPFGLRFLFSLTFDNKRDKIILLLFYSSLLIKLCFSLFSIAGFTYNNVKYYSHEAVKAIIHDKVSSGYIYTPDPSMSVALYPKVLLGPWDERGYLTSKYFHDNYFLKIKSMMGQSDIKAAVISGSDCKSWKPTSPFAPDFTKRRPQLISQGKICILFP